MAKKVSVTKLEEAAKKYIGAETELEWNGLTISVKKNLSIADSVQFINLVFAACFNAESNAYVPEAKDFAIRELMIRSYTNISLPANIEKRFDILYDTDLVGVVRKAIDDDQFGYIINSIEERITVAIDANNAMLKRQMEDMYMAIDNLKASMTSALDGIDMDDVKLLISSLSNVSINEDELVKAVARNLHNEQSDA